MQDVNTTLLKFKVEQGNWNPSFVELSDVSPIKDRLRFAALCRNVIKNGKPQQFSDFVIPFDEQI